MVPTLTTYPPVFDKLRGGADLMLPGVIMPDTVSNKMEQFSKDCCCAVNLVGNGLVYSDLVSNGVKIQPCH